MPSTNATQANQQVLTPNLLRRMDAISVHAKQANISGRPDHRTVENALSIAKVFFGKTTGLSNNVLKSHAELPEDFKQSSIHHENVGNTLVAVENKAALQSERKTSADHIAAYCTPFRQAILNAFVGVTADPTRGVLRAYKDHHPELGEHADTATFESLQMGIWAAGHS